jgi:hypothetical protein
MFGRREVVRIDRSPELEEYAREVAREYGLGESLVPDILVQADRIVADYRRGRRRRNGKCGG